MKKGIVLLLLCCISIVGFGQGIWFEKSFEKALVKAKFQNKKVFVDVYTSWCGPCKAMEKNTFTQPQVGDFFNRNYVSVKVDAEKGNGPEIAKRFGVKSYPTLIFLDSDGQFIHKKEGGLNAASLIFEAKKSLSPKAKELRVMMDSYVAGDMPNEEIPDYLKLLKEVKLSCNDVLDVYVSSLKKRALISENTYKMISVYSDGVSSTSFKLLVDNYKKFNKKLKSDVLYQLIYNRYVFESYNNKRANKSSGPMYAYLKEAGIEFVDDIKENYDLVMALKDQFRHEEVIVRAEKLFARNPMSYSYLLNEVVKQASHFPVMARFAEKSIKDFANFNKDGAAATCGSMAYLYLLNHKNHKEALRIYLMGKGFSSDKDYQKKSIEYCQNQLGLIKCENYGKQAPDFTLPDVNGKHVSLKDFKGKYVLIDFWASWCGPCKGEVPYLKKAYQKYGSKGLEIVSISSDKDTDAWKKAIKEGEQTWVQLLDAGSDTAKRFEVSGIPRIMLLGKDGKILADNLRGEAIEREVSKHL